MLEEEIKKLTAAVKELTASMTPLQGGLDPAVVKKAPEVPKVVMTTTDSSVSKTSEDDVRSAFQKLVARFPKDYGVRGKAILRSFKAEKIPEVKEQFFDELIQTVLEEVKNGAI